MKELIEYIAKELVSQPEKVEVIEQDDSKGNILIRLKVDSNDMGKVIGRNGKIAKAMRSLLDALGTKNRVNIQLEIIDEI
ncbi:MAG: KH domain-containing protein [Tissierellia bacterium]|nr:KH domain-containing protein [Tissierellia bacterium]